MKNIKTSIVITVCATCISAGAQTSNPQPSVVVTPPAVTVTPPQAGPVATPMTPQSFFTSVEAYVTAFDTNSQTFSTNASWELGAGASYQQGLNLGGTAFIEWKPIGGKGFTVGNVSTFAGVVGTIAQEELDLGYSIRHYDLELTFGVLGIDTFHSLGNDVPAGLKGGVFMEAKKALTQNTFAGLRIQDEWGAKGKGAQPPVTFLTGFTF